LHEFTSNHIEGKFYAVYRLAGEQANREGGAMSSNVFDKLEMPATVEDVVREVSKIRATVTEAVDDGVKLAIRTMKQGRDAAEDVIDDARRSVKRNPLQSMGIVFAVGVLAGCVLGFVGRRR
jgi:ElaB/YqjD/DUF883 family membrane-anchored ribosome-binding protein